MICLGILWPTWKKSAVCNTPACFSVIWTCICTFLHVFACGPKTVPVKCTILNIAIVGWSGVGWGGMLTFLVLRTWYIAMLLRSLGSFTTLHVATLLRSLGSFTTLHAATLLRSLGSFTTLHVLCGIWWKSQFPATWVPKVTSWWCMLELGNGDASTRMLTASW